MISIMMSRMCALLSHQYFINICSISSRAVHILVMLQNDDGTDYSMESVKGPFSPDWDAKTGDSRREEEDSAGASASAKKSGKKATGRGSNNNNNNSNSNAAADYQRVASTRGSAKKASKAD